MDPQMTYEYFVRFAFGLALDKKVGQLEDPAEFADAGVITSGNLAEAKIGTGYAIGIMTKHIRNTDMDKFEVMNGYLERVLAAQSVKEVVAIIEDFEANVTEKYFDRVEGLLQPK